MSTSMYAVRPSAPSFAEPEIGIRRTDARPKSTRLLSISPSVEDHLALRRILDDKTLGITVAHDCVEAASQLSDHPAQIVVCERDLPDGSWVDLWRRLDRQATPPVFIVTSRHADAGLWAEVLNLGGYDVLAKPFDEEEVRRVLRYARSR